MTRIALLRHFPTDWNEAGRLQGRVDRPLTAASEAALRGLAPPGPWAAARAIASPLSRARRTAELLGLAFETDERLVEMDLGGWEGRRGVDLLEDPASGYGHVESWGWDGGPPDGESPAAVRARLLPLLAEIAAGGEPVLLVCHRGVIRVVLAMAHGWDYDRPEPFRIKKGRLNEATLAADGRPSGDSGPIRLVPRP